MTLQQLKYAVELSSSSSMNEAAKRLYISQPSLSLSIRDLEEELSITLFERTNRGIQPTPEGLAFLQEARQIVEQATLLEQRFSDGRGQRERLSIASQHYAFAALAFSNLICAHPQERLELEFLETRTLDILERVKSLKSELGLLFLHEGNRRMLNKLLEESKLRFIPLFNTAAHVFLHQHHPLATQKSISLRELSPYPYLTFAQGDQSPLYFQEEFSPEPLHPDQVIRVGDRSTLADFLFTTDAYTLGTGFVVDEFYGKTLRSIPLQDDRIYTVGWISRKDIKLSPLALEFLDILTATIDRKNLSDETFLL